MLRRYRREASIALVIAALGILLAAAAPGYFARDNLSDLFLGNMPVLIVALGATIVILTGHIDISAGSIFAICGVVAGLTAKAGGSIAFAALAACLCGAVLGSVNGLLVAYARIPSVVVTLATMVALRDGLRWTTQGAWVQDLPGSFQWFGLSQAAYPMVAFAIAAALQAGLGWGLRNLAGGRAVYATGSHEAAARLAGLNTRAIACAAFVAAGALTGLAAVLNAVRFNQIPSNAGIGLEMKVIAAAVVGGASVRGGLGNVWGTLLGVVLLGAIGPALTFLGVSAYWERALQGGIILAAVAIDAIRERRASPALTSAAAPA